MKRSSKPTLLQAAKEFLRRRIDIFPVVRGAENCRALANLEAAVDRAKNGKP